MKLLPSLLADLKAVCGAFPDPRKGRGGNIAVADFGLSAFAMFFMQSASFLSFQRSLDKGRGRSNCHHPDRLRRLPFLARLPPIPRDFHYSAGTPQNPKNRMKRLQNTTFRIAAPLVKVTQSSAFGNH